MADLTVAVSAHGQSFPEAISGIKVRSPGCANWAMPMENRNDRMVDLETTLATGTAEREAAEAMVERSVK
jgi:5-carboxymethyl-2-hydroxymuconate isomerase